ncbi:MAG TPA: SatD family protein, partial [Gemmatimonadales bacterium]|nr:SatD family protein [Gemmatimonadales bacterium]
MSKSVTQYIAVLADAVGSRRLAASARQALQQQLRSVLTAANRKWRNAIAARFAITLGDQLEGLVAADAPLWEIVHYLRAELDGDWIIS